MANGNSLRSMLAGKMGNQSAQMTGVKPGAPPMQNPAVGGMPPGMGGAVTGPGAPQAPPPTEPMMPGGGDEDAMMMEQAGQIDPQMQDLIAFLRDMPPEKIIEWAMQLPPEAQEGFIQLAVQANPALLGYLGEATGVGPDDMAGLAQQAGGQVPAGMGPGGPVGPPQMGMGPGGPPQGPPPGGMNIRDQL